MTGAQRSDVMKNLVLFMICLAIVGSLVAGLYCYAAAQEAALHPPTNTRTHNSEQIGDCIKECDLNHPTIWDLLAGMFCYNWCDSNV
jgi:hypothetical protein